ncbi:MAG: hypothetical protein K5644_06910 [Lachnospiraceae bacterium]|nr:hypothetical protein [Lachnospiraceae bacterium]
MYKVTNDENSVMLRRHRNRLSMSGMAMIIFSIWSVIRYTIIILQNKDDYNFHLDLDEGTPTTVKFIGYAILLLLTILFLTWGVLPTLLLGRAAIKVGKGKKKSVVYLVFTAIYIVISILPYAFGEVFEDNQNLILLIVTIILDITMFGACIDILYSGIKVRICEKRIAEKEDV